MEVSPILCIFAALLLFSLCTCRDHHQNLNLDRNLNISWTINSTKKTIRFKVKARIHETGWFLIGFEPQKPKAPEGVKKTRGDAFVVWWKTVNRAHGKTPAWTVTDCNTINSGNIQRDKKQDYHLPKNLIKTMYNSTTNIVTAIVWRYLDTKDKEDVVIKKRSMFIFGSYGNEDPSKKFKKELQSIKQDSEDNFLQASNVNFFEVNSSKKKDGRNLVKYAGQMAEQHWIGLVVGMSAFLTVIITCTVYCFAKKAAGGIRKKHASMSFHKESEYDDEAKVAFLQSEET